MTGVITGKKDPVFSEFRELDVLKNRIALSKFIVEDALIVGRAVFHGLAVEKIIYTERFLNEVNSDNACGNDILAVAKDAKIENYKINDGLLSAITSTRPLPSVVAMISHDFFDIGDINFNNNRTFLVIDSVANPDNLGMILRTADASGIDGLAIIGDGANIFHKNCIRAARGAVGRIKVLTGENENYILERLKSNGVCLIGTSGETKDTIYDHQYNIPTAFVVGNESFGIRPKILAQCDKIVRIPMLDGRDSLSVAVAAGIVLYEMVRVCYNDKSYQNKLIF